MEKEVTDDQEMLQVGGIHEMDYWCEPQKLFKYLDTVSPTSGSKFKCSVCSGDQWGCSTVGIKVGDNPMRDLVTPCDMPLLLPNGKRLQMEGKDFPNFHYALVCLTCANTIFLNAAMVQARIKLTERMKDGQ